MNDAITFPLEIQPIVHAYSISGQTIFILTHLLVFSIEPFVYEEMVKNLKISHPIGKIRKTT